MLMHSPSAEKFPPRRRAGQKTEAVGEIMRTGNALPLVPLDEPMDKVLLVITGKGFGCAVVVDYQ